MKNDERPNLDEGELIVDPDGKEHIVSAVDSRYDGWNDRKYWAVFTKDAVTGEKSGEYDLRYGTDVDRVAKLIEYKVIDRRIKIGDIVEITAVSDEDRAELDFRPQGKVVSIDPENNLRPYRIRPLDGTAAEELDFSLREFQKLVSALDAEKRPESMKVLDKRITKVNKKLEELRAAMVPLEEELEALTTAREVLDYVKN